jgi:hypothetical protein
MMEEATVSLEEVKMEEEQDVKRKLDREKHLPYNEVTTTKHQVTTNRHGRISIENSSSRRQSREITIEPVRTRGVINAIHYAYARRQQQEAPVVEATG